jgi:hypothetical protein
VRFYLATPIPDGNFRATLSGVKDSGNNALAGGVSQDFFFLLGDANHDRIVNALDFNALASQYGATNSGYSSGDFDFSTIVNSVDFSILATTFGHRLAAPAGSAPLGALAASTSPNSLFSAPALTAPLGASVAPATLFGSTAIAQGKDLLFDNTSELPL